MFKKTISILLSMILILTTVTLCIQAQADEFSFLVTSDIHFRATPKEAPIVYPGCKYYCADDSTNLLSESKAIVKEFLREATQSDAQCILISGDMVDDGSVKDHKKIIKLFRNFEKETGKRILVINGNHDFNSGISIDEFKTLYAEFGYDEALTVDPNTCSYTAELDGKYRLLAVDSCNHIDGTDGMNEQILAWMDTQVQQAKADGKELIVMMHHNFLEHIKMQSILMPKYIIDGKWKMKKRFVDWGVRYVFTGHQHGQDITSYTDLRTNRRVYDIMTTALTSYPCAYRICTLTPEGMDVRVGRITGVQAQDLATGYTPELLQELTTDLDTYAYGCFSMNFGARKGALFSTDTMHRIAAKTRIKPLVDVVDAYFPTFFAYFDMPIYAENADGASLQAMAEELGLSLPQSEYGTISDLLFYFIMIYYYGDEALPFTDETIDLFVRCAYTALYVSLRDVSAQKKASLTADLRGNFKADALPYMATRLGQSLTGAAKDECVLQLMTVMISPIIEALSIDDAVADNDVFLSKTDASGNSAVRIITQIIAWIVRFTLRYVNGMSRLAKMY